LNSNTSQKSNVSFIEVSSVQVNQRLDNFLLKMLKNVPRTRIYRIIRKGEVRVNKKRCKPDYKLAIGDLIRVPPVRIEQQHDPKTYIAPGLIESIEKAVLFENRHLMVIDKPAGLAVHSGSGISFGVIDIMRRIRPETEIELVHRLDRDTSGCLLLAKHRQSLLEMQRRLQDNSLNKNYLAIVKGHWPEHKTEISHTLIKTTLANGERRVRVDPAGKKALTRITKIVAGEGYSQLSIQLLTGRTHQIRVHCQAEGHELAGDTKYGDEKFNKEMRKLGIKRLMLHASSLELPRTEFNPETVINAASPDVFNRLIIAHA
jgi:23S rRNA pseudouridine955/2504/2580 synthase